MSTTRKLTLKSCAVRGPAGKSAYEAAVEAGYEGTAAEYYAIIGGVPDELTRINVVNGRQDAILEYLGTQTSSLDERITAQENRFIPAIDYTLTVANAAADAKVVGANFSQIKADVGYNANLFTAYENYIVSATNGVLYENHKYVATKQAIPVSEGDIVSVKGVPTNRATLTVVFYSAVTDMGGTFVSAVTNPGGASTPNFEVAVPAGAKYLRITLGFTVATEASTVDPCSIYINYSMPIKQTVSDLVGKVNNVTPEQTTFFDYNDLFSANFVEFVSGMVDDNGVYWVRDNFALTSIKIKVKPSTTYILQIPGANRNTGTNNADGIFASGSSYSTMQVTRSGNNLTFTTSEGCMYALLYFYGGTYDMQGNVGNIHLYEGSIKANNSPTIKINNLPTELIYSEKPLDILVFGDSISDTANITIDSNTNTTTAYSIKNPNNSYVMDGTTITYSMWPTLIQKVLRIRELRNYAASGAHFYSTANPPANPRQKLLYQVQVAFNDLNNPNGVFAYNDFSPDIIIVACGINDGNVPSGAYEATMAKTVMNAENTGVDVEATMNAMNQYDPMDAMRYVLMMIKHRFPTALLLYVNPLQQAYGTNTDRLTSRNEFRKMVEQYAFINLDGFGQFGVVRDFEVEGVPGLLTKDGLHPNEKGQNLYARNIVQAIKRYYYTLSYFN